MFNKKALIAFASIVFLFTLGHSALSQETSSKHPLSPIQLAAFKKIRTETENKATPLVIDLAKIAKEIFANMLADKEDQKLRRKLNARLHATAGRLLYIKGQSFREMLAILTPEQKAFVRAEMQKSGAPADFADVMDRVFDMPGK